MKGRSLAEFIAKLGVAVEEIDEAVGWLEHMRDSRIASDFPEITSVIHITIPSPFVARTPRNANDFTGTPLAIRPARADLKTRQVP